MHGSTLQYSLLNSMKGGKRRTRKASSKKRKTGKVRRVSTRRRTSRKH